MYNKIMVPLDGSKVAECVLPHVESFADGHHVESVVFITVVDLEELSLISEPTIVAPEEKIERVREVIASEAVSRAHRYLEESVRQLEPRYGKGRLQTVVLTGKAAESLVSYAEENDVDLIIIASHGHSDVRRWAWGSTADKILRSARVPVLMIRASCCAPDAA